MSAKRVPFATEEKVGSHLRDSGGQDVHVLVVDDEPEIADSLAEFLSRTAGYRVTVAVDGQKAMEILEASTDGGGDAVDLVLLDVRMPEVSGPEVLSWLRGHPELRYTRVIVLTAAAGNEEKVEALLAGADDYITKPYYPLELLARLKTILRTQQLEKQLQRQSQQLLALNRVSRLVTAKLATSEVLAAAAEGIEAIVRSEVSAVFMTDNSRTHLLCRYIHPVDGRLSVESYPPVEVGVGAIGQAYREERSVRFNSPIADSRFLPELEGRSDFNARSVLATPFYVRGKPVGVLCALNKRGGRFNQVDRGLLSALASSVSRALEIAWLFQNVRQRQQDLLESRNTLQAVIDGILHPIYTITEEWKLVAVNMTKAKELEASPAELAGQRCYEAFFQRDSPCEHCAVAGTLAEHEPIGWTVSWLGKDHWPREWDVNSFPIPVSAPNSASAIVIWQDRTEERRLENSLVQAGKLAAIGQLAAGVAHEINNPLTAINANAQMLEMTMSPDDDNYESVELIVQAGDRAAKVVRGLLDFARQSQFEFEMVDVNGTIMQALGLVAYQFTVANIKVIKKLAAGLPQVDASWEHLESVWLNLLINSRDALASLPGEKQVEIVSRLDSTGKEVLVFMRDNGHGMATGELAHAFEPFFTTKGPGQGTGLGLANCRRIIEQHGGKIEVSSSAREGTTFIVRLPVSR
jgi:two-component system NtrC family sensor kinase